MRRPKNLPDFKSPPLNEVVLGVQFAPAEGYQQIRAGEVWALFRDEFPLVEEHPPLPPSFETFGLPQSQLGQVSVGIVTGASHDRFWFLSPDEDELIQFQHDRLLHNWRKVGDKKNVYPRFEKMIAKFTKELGSLDEYFSELSPQSLEINQSEISYINHIIPEELEASINPENWLNFLQFTEQIPDDLNISFRHIINDDKDNAYGHLICSASTATNKEGKKMIALNLTVRGAPLGTDIKSALDFLQMGREVIVKFFAEITTDSAHKIWERVQ